MRPNWPKLVILAPKTCTLVSFQFFAVNIGGTRSGGRVGARFRIFGGGGGGGWQGWPNFSLAVN